MIEIFVNSCPWCGHFPELGCKLGHSNIYRPEKAKNPEMYTFIWWLTCRNPQCDVSIKSKTQSIRKSGLYSIEAVAAKFSKLAASWNRSDAEHSAYLPITWDKYLKFLKDKIKEEDY